MSDRDKLILAGGHAVAIAEGFLRADHSRKEAICNASIVLADLILIRERPSLFFAVQWLVLAIINGAFEGCADPEWRVFIAAGCELVRAEIRGTLPSQMKSAA